jgi:hypothetical protein
MIITVRQLQLIHYYYFIMGIFALSNAIFLGIGSPYFLLFIMFYIVNSTISWYIAVVARETMKNYIIIQSLAFAIKHMIATVAAVAIAAVIWMGGTMMEFSVLSALLMTNYMILFLAGIWYVLTRTDFAKKLFPLYDDYMFRRSRNFVIRTREKNWKYFGIRLITEREITNYKYGTLPDVDSNMLSAYRNRGQLRYVMECIGRIEMLLSQMLIERLSDEIKTARLMYRDGSSDWKLREMENMIIQERQNYKKFEMRFYEKTGEGE